MLVDSQVPGCPRCVEGSLNPQPKSDFLDPCLPSCECASRNPKPQRKGLGFPKQRVVWGLACLVRE